MEISKHTFNDFNERIKRENISKEDLVTVVENLSYLATDNGFDKEGFFDELLELLQ